VAIVLLDYVGNKPSALSTNLGASLTANRDNIEYGVGYDVNIADKYLGHQGSVKVRVSF
jgi:hypothetical protein